MLVRSARRSWALAALPVAAGLFVGAAWLGVSLYFLRQLRSADTLRSQADRLRIDLLECRRREKDFLLRSLSDRAFYEKGTTPYLDRHREALDRLERDCQELRQGLPPDWAVDVAKLEGMAKDYGGTFAQLVETYRRLGYRDFGLEGTWRAGRVERDWAVATPGRGALDRALLDLRNDENEFLLRGDEASFQAVRRSSLRLDEAVRRELPEKFPKIAERLDRTLKDMEAYFTLLREIGLSENEGLQLRFRTAAHEIEPVVAQVVGLADRAYAAASRQLMAGLLVATGLLSALLATTFFLTRSAKVRSSELSHTASELSRSNAELQQFAYVASHDLQEPLRAVAGCVGLLQQRSQGKLDPKSEELIKHVEEGCVRMQTLIEDLLTLSRIGTREAALAAVDSGRVLQAALDNLAVPIQESGATVTHDLLPTLKMDPTQLLQILQNLIGNAIKFRGPRPPIIHVGAAREGQDWRLWVRDNGIGIEPRHFERIFRVFQRLHTREEYPGSGIGLAVCEKIVLRQGGRIWLESEPDRGSTFYFTIPDGGDLP